MTGTDCELCTAVDGALPDWQIVAENSVGVALVTNRQRAWCAVIVAPRAHVSSLAELADDECLGIGQLLQRVVVAVERATGPEALNTWSDNGELAEQPFPHVCFEVVPRRADDGYRFICWAELSQQSDSVRMEQAAILTSVLAEVR